MPIPLVSEQDFEREVLRAELPVLVDLFADWCQPCKQLTPILEQVATELQGKLKIVRVDVERSPILARSFRVQSIPMLVLIAQGRPVDQVVNEVLAWLRGSAASLLTAAPGGNRAGSG